MTAGNVAARASIVDVTAGLATSLPSRLDATAGIVIALAGRVDATTGRAASRAVLFAAEGQTRPLLCAGERG